MKGDECTKKTALLALCLALLLVGCSDAPITRSDTMLDTVVSVTLYDGGGSELLEQCMAHIREREALWSRTAQGSDIFTLNASSGKPVTLNADTVKLLGDAKRFCELTEGAFDVTVGPLRNLWERAQESGTAPSSEELQGAASLVGSDKMLFDGNSVTLKEPGMGVDLGGIAKGQIADELVSLLRGAGCQSALIDLGGNIAVLGSKPNGEAFSVGIADPRNPDEIIATVSARDGSVVTSGSYERSYRVGEHVYSHILNPKTGEPVEGDLLSVTILSPSSLTADALSTACFVMGLERARSLLDTLPDVEAVFVTGKGEVIATDPERLIDVPD